MNTMQKFLALGAIAAASAPFASATVITAGGANLVPTAVTVVNNGILAQTSGNLAGVDGSGTTQFTGTYVEYVIKDGANIYGANDLTFVIQITNTTSFGTPPDQIENVNNGKFLASVFGGVQQVNVGADAAINGLPTLAAGDTDMPTGANESASGVVQFNFTSPNTIKTGTGTEYLVIQTADTNYMQGQLNVIDDATASVNTFMPMANTPEPSSLALLGTGLIGGASALLRRRRSMVL